MRRAHAVAEDSLLGARVRAVDAEAFVPGFGGSATPARRAFDSPIAIACFAERAP